MEGRETEEVAWVGHGGVGRPPQLKPGDHKDNAIYTNATATVSYSTIYSIIHILFHRVMVLLGAKSYSISHETGILIIYYFKHTGNKKLPKGKQEAGLQH